MEVVLTENAAEQIKAALDRNNRFAWSNRDEGSRRFVIKEDRRIQDARRVEDILNDLFPNG